MTLRLLDLFSGIGAFSLGLEQSGLCRTVGFVEIEPHAQAVLRRHWPDVPIHGDITTYEFKKGEADVICGGFPCQDVSCAGKRAGLAGARSGLYRELVRAIRVVRPRLALVENVAMLLSDGMGTVLGDLAESGYNLEWDCIPACAVGAPHERDRVFIVAHANGQRGLQPEGTEREQRQWTGDCTQASTSDPTSQQMGAARQPWLNRGLEGKRLDPDATGIGCGQGRPGRPPDSFARIRDETRRNAADLHGARLAFREGLTRDAWEKLTPAERDAFKNERQSIWPDEPALQGVDDVTPHWMDRVRETGNTIVRLIPQLIGESILLASGQSPHFAATVQGANDAAQETEATS